MSLPEQVGLSDTINDTTEANNADYNETTAPTTQAYPHAKIWSEFSGIGNRSIENGSRGAKRLREKGARRTLEVANIIKLILVSAFSTDEGVRGASRRADFSATMR